MDNDVNQTVGKEQVLTMEKNIEQRYPFFRILGTPLAFETWFEVFEKGIPERAALRNSFNETGYFLKRRKPTWQRLWSRYSINDSVFESLIYKIVDELDNRKYTDIGEFLHIAGLMSSFVDKKIKILDENKVNGQLIEYVEWMVDNKHVEPNMKGYESYPRGSAFNLGFTGERTAGFKAVLNHLDLTLEKAKVSLVKSSVEMLLNKFENEISEFLDMTTEVGGDGRFASVPILAELPTKRFALILLKHMENGEIWNVYRLLDNRYNYIKQELSPEKEWLEELSVEIEALAEARSGLLSGAKLTDFLQCDPFKNATKKFSKARVDKSGY